MALTSVNDVLSAMNIFYFREISEPFEKIGIQSLRQFNFYKIEIESVVQDNIQLMSFLIPIKKEVVPSSTVEGFFQYFRHD